MGDENVYFMEIVSDTDSTDTTVNSGHTDDEEFLPEPRQPLLAEVIRRADEEAGIQNVVEDQNGAVGGEIGEREEELENADDSDDDPTQPGLGAEPDDENEPEPEPNKEESPMKRASETMLADDDGQICTICFEPWTSSNEHRLVSLRCGHLYGRSCISKWLRGQGSRCPQCNARARKSEIRPIYAKCLKVLDTSERDRALRDLERESVIRKKAEMECAQLRLKYHMMMTERDFLKSELSTLKRLQSQGTEKPAAIKPSSSSFVLSSVSELNYGCRVLDCNETLDLMVVSQQSTNPIFKGYGLRKISLPGMRLCEYVHLHQRPIKDVSFHGNNGLVLTASFDRTLKLTNCLNNSMVQTYNVECEAWSCAWDLDDSCYFYAGVRTGHVYRFDIRVTDRHVEQFEGPNEASPVIAIEYIKRDALSSPRKSGPVFSHLSSCYYYEKLNAACFQKHQLPLEGNFTSLSYDFTTSHLLASCRPSAKHPRVTHTLCSISCEENDGFQCNLVQGMVGGFFQAQLSRSKLTKHPTNANSVLVCAGDEESKSAMIWDGSTGARLSTLKAESAVLDMAMFGQECDRANLATLTEKNLRVYKWSADS